MHISTHSAMRSANRKLFVTDPPSVTVDNVKDYLANDKLFTDYFNTFLSLPMFPVAYHYSNNKGLFRVNAELDRDPLRPNEAPHLSKTNCKFRVSARRHSFQPIPLLHMENIIKVHHKRTSKQRTSTLILNKRKGLLWIQNERLSLFLQSRLYAEYRLAKILSQSTLIRHDKTNVSDLYLTFVPLEEPARAISSPVCEDDAIGLPSESKTESVAVLFGDATQSEIDTWNYNVQILNKVGYDIDFMDKSDIYDFSDDSLPPSSEKISCVMFADIGPATYVMPGLKPADVPKGSEEPLHVKDMQELAMMLIAAVMKSAIVEVENVTEEEVESSPTYRQSFPSYEKGECKVTMDLFKNPVVLDQHVDMTARVPELRDLVDCRAIFGDDTSLLFSMDEQTSFPPMNDPNEDDTFPVRSMDVQRDQYPDNDPLDPDDRKDLSFSTNMSIREFRALLKERSCEKNWFLWIDLEKFKLCKTAAGKEISILAIKNKYYNTTPHFELSSDLKTEIDITNWKSLTDEKVGAIQRKILEPIFQYWMPLYLLKKQIIADPSKYRSYFTLKKVRSNRTRCCTPELDNDVSIFVLKSSIPEEKRKMAAVPDEAGPFDVLPLPRTEPNIGNRRTYLMSTLLQDSIAKHYDCRKGEQKRHSFPDSKVKTEQEKTSNFIDREDQDLIMPFCRRSMSAGSQETIWPNSHVNIVQVDKKVQVGKRVLPKELSCIKILRSQSKTRTTNLASSCKDKDSGEKKLEGKKYKLLSSLFNALKCERVSGDVFALYLQEKDLEKHTNCLMLWDAISKFLCLFYRQPVVWPKVVRQVKLIHAEYLSESARLNVECNYDIMSEVKNHLNEPTGDMFQTVAEHVLAVLLPSWKQFRNEEKRKASELLKNA